MATTTESVPAEGKSVPAEEKGVPAESKSVPAESKSVPAETKSVPTETKSVPAEDKSVPAESKSLPAEDKSVPAEDKSVPTEDKSVPAEDKSVPADKKSVRVETKKNTDTKKKTVTFARTTRFTYETPERLKQLEQGFLLDGVALNHLANNEVDRTQPSLNFGIPQYKAVADKHCKTYFRRRGVPEKAETASSMMGDVFDKFLRSSEAKSYLQDRTGIGAGYTRKIYGGHLTVPTCPPTVGYHGPEGYRRNTPHLRRFRSDFDNEDPFDNVSPVVRRLRTQSAPATLRIMRQKSASVYRSFPGGRRVQSAMPRPTSATMAARELATGPLT